MIEIKNRFGETIFFSRNLSGLDLTGLNLNYAYLRECNLTGLELASVSLIDAELSLAILKGANLSFANLTDADLTKADIRMANLTKARLDGVILEGAQFDNSILDANWEITKNDLFNALDDALTNEVSYLRDAIQEGRIDGRFYYGECRCLVGTIAEARGVTIDKLRDTTLCPDSSRPAERFFYNILGGDTPETNPLSKLALEWVNQWLEADKNDHP